MTKLELLNVFLNDRLTAAAQEIFRAVKDTVVEYQREILRSKEENERLKRLLNVAVQRLLLQPEAQSVHPQEEEQLCESEWRSGSELQLQVKQEPNFRHVQINCSHDEGDTTEEPPPQRPVQTACIRASESPARTSQEVKTDTDKESFPLAGCLSSPLHAGSDRGTHGDPGGQTPKAELSGCVGQRAFLCSNSKQSVPSAQLKNVRSLKHPPPRPSHPNQSKQRWHSCKECGKSFSFACQLEVHMRWHTKEKPYSCAVCRKSFTTVSMLKRHHRIHTGEKPFRCHVCGKCFNQSAHLNTHFRLHTRERASWSRAPHPRNPQAT